MSVCVSIYVLWGDLCVCLYVFGYISWEVFVCTFVCVHGCTCEFMHVGVMYVFVGQLHASLEAPMCLCEFMCICGLIYVWGRIYVCLCVSCHCTVQKIV